MLKQRKLDEALRAGAASRRVNVDKVRKALLISSALQLTVLAAIVLICSGDFPKTPLHKFSVLID